MTDVDSGSFVVTAWIIQAESSWHGFSLTRIGRIGRIKADLKEIFRPHPLRA
jgi:hypothetical protein